ncbi:MAG: 6-phosphofructokinase [Bdellovibrionales bacterium]|nr:6-phosphofructokinase [Bdellovibrionales bacterium]
MSYKKIGILTSGGDSPGMNAAIRAVVRSSLQSGMECFGLLHGYQGLISKQMIPLSAGSVANTIQRGGTFLKTGRCQDMYQPEGRKRAADGFKDLSLEALVVIGGDGTYAGANLLGEEHGIPCVGLPGTIDNDITGTDYTIGFDTAVNTALEAIDRIRDTAASHDRLFIVEVMGRESGFIAVDVALAGGAEAVFIPENFTSIDNTIDHIRKGIARGKMSSILVASEGQNPGRAYDLAEQIRRKSHFEAKVCVLGHVQRGGSPTAKDRIMASRMGEAAVACLVRGEVGVMIALQREELVSISLKTVSGKKKTVPAKLLELLQVLST